MTTQTENTPGFRAYLEAELERNIDHLLTLYASLADIGRGTLLYLEPKLTKAIITTEYAVMTIARLLGAPAYARDFTTSLRLWAWGEIRAMVKTWPGPNPEDAAAWANHLDKDMAQAPTIAHVCTTWANIARMYVAGEDFTPDGTASAVPTPKEPAPPKKVRGGFFGT